MGMKAEGLGDLSRAMLSMDQQISAAERRSILTDAAQPIEEKMKAQASKDPKMISHDLHDAISTSNVKTGKRGKQVTIGVHRKDWHNKDYYPVYVEYGHGGPAPAGAHPYIRPSFDEKKEEAYKIIRDRLATVLKSI